MGRLIPAGTGMEYYRRVKIAGEEIEEEVLAEAEAPLEGLETCADETRLHYSGGLSETGPDLEPFEANSAIRPAGRAADPAVQRALPAGSLPQR